MFYTQTYNFSDIEEVDEEESKGEFKENAKSAKKRVTSNTLTRLTELPLAKIRHIIKLDPEVNLVNGKCLCFFLKDTNDE
jgi:hypothetical protein